MIKFLIILLKTKDFIMEIKPVTHVIDKKIYKHQAHNLLLCFLLSSILIETKIMYLNAMVLGTFNQWNMGTC